LQPGWPTKPKTESRTAYICYFTELRSRLTESRTVRHSFPVQKDVFRHGTSLASTSTSPLLLYSFWYQESTHAFNARAGNSSSFGFPCRAGSVRTPAFCPSCARPQRASPVNMAVFARSAVCAHIGETARFSDGWLETDRARLYYNIFGCWLAGESERPVLGSF